MKKITQKSQKEEAVYFSDFSSEGFEEFPPVTINISFGYGSKYDGTDIEIHLSDKEFSSINDYLLQQFNSESKKHYTKALLFEKRE